jgi:hypothetical protein
MKKILSAFLFISLLFAVALAVERQAAPRFENYAVPVYKGNPAPVNLNSAKGARMFRTNLREGARKGVNFAGHYALITWGCGAGCVDVGIVDEKTGSVYFPKEIAGFNPWYWDDNEEPLQFKPDSRLLVLSGFPGTEANLANPRGGLYYYEWTGARLRLVKYVAKKRDEGR